MIKKLTVFKKYWTCSKNLNAVKIFFELADGIGIRQQIKRHPKSWHYPLINYLGLECQINPFNGLDLIVNHMRRRNPNSSWIQQTSQWNTKGLCLSIAIIILLHDRKGEIFLTLLLMSAIAAQTKWGQSRFEFAYNLQTFKIYFFILQQFTDWISIEWLIQFKYSGKATKFVKKNPTSSFNYLVQLNILGYFFKLFWLNFT